MLSLTIYLVMLATSRFVSAQGGLPYPNCTSGVPYTASGISRIFDNCVPAFAYGVSYSVPSNPYPTNAAACVNLCTGPCVAANWVEGNNCQLALGSIPNVSTGPYWNPTWTAYLLRTTPPIATTLISRPTASTANLISPILPILPSLLPLPPLPNLPILTIPNVPSPSASRINVPSLTASSITSISTLGSSTTASLSSIASVFTSTGSISSASSSSPATARTLLSPLIQAASIIAPEPSPVCPVGNGTIYTNSFGTQFSINCGFDLYDADPESRTIQPSFQSCIDDCDNRFAGRCPGVTWVSEKQWCYFKPSTATLQPSADNLWSAVKMPGPEGMTCPQLNGTIYTDNMYTDLLVDQYFIYCGFELLDSTTTRRSEQVTFEACINDCHDADDCDGVTWRPNGEDLRWCYHKSRSAVVGRSGQNYWSAQKIHGANVPGSNTQVKASSLVSATLSSKTQAAFDVLKLPTILPPISLTTSLSISSPARAATFGLGPQLLSSSVVPTCPAANQTIYTSGDGSRWRIECNLDYAGNDWYQVQTAGLQQCVNTCASRGPSCPAAVLVPSRNPNCYLKNGIPPAANILRQPFQCDTAVRLE